MALTINLPICIQSGDCGLCDILAFVGSIFELLIVLLAAGAFIMLIVGSIYFVLSRGNPETRKKGISILTSVTAGVFIGLLAWQIVNLTIFILVGGSQFKETGQPVKYKVFGNPWNEVCGSESFKYSAGCLEPGGAPKLDGTDCLGGGHCQSGICSGGELICLGISDGSPCNNGKGHCLNGACENGDSCNYLATDAKYAGKFGAGRTILKGPNDAEFLKEYQCVNVSRQEEKFILAEPKGSLKDSYPLTLVGSYNSVVTLDCLESLCPSSQLCCGETAGN